MTTLLLVRHGESEANRRDLFAGDFDAKLEQNGIDQAKLTAKYIKDNYKVSKVYASNLQRAYKTGEIIAEELKVGIEADKRLREISGGEWEGEPFADLLIKYKEEFSLWKNDLGRAGCPGGETVRELGDRVMEALYDIAKNNSDKNIVIATHATPIRVAESIIKTGDIVRMSEFPWVSNASVSVLEYDNGSFKVIEMSRDEHLADIRTVLPDTI